MSVSELLSLLQGISFLKPYMGVVTAIVVGMALLYTAALGYTNIEKRCLSNKSLAEDIKNKSLDNEKKRLDNQNLEKQLAEPKKDAPAQDAVTSSTKAT
ncbi:hypothetical protein ABEP50_22405 [Priestia megaterium]